jgi:hypothetical protein
MIDISCIGAGEHTSKIYTALPAARYYNTAENIDNDSGRLSK